MHEAPSPAQGSYADGFEAVAQTFADQLERGEEIGAALSVYRHGEPVVDLWGGLADVTSDQPWKRDTRIVVFSVTKGLAAMAMHMIADRGLIEWDAPVADYWPGFGTKGKAVITVEQLLCHRGGLCYLDRELSIRDCVEPRRAKVLTAALEEQQPAWTPGTDQGYHALTFGLYVTELFARATGQTMGDFLRRELFEPLGSDARLGTPPTEDHRMASLYGPPGPARALRMIGRSLSAPASTEARILRAVLRRDSLTRKAFANPASGPRGLAVYNSVPVRRAQLASASATASADGIARAYLPFASRGAHDGRSYVAPATLAGAEARLSWSSCDRVLLKPIGWSRGFLKEQRHLFSPNAASFGHAGMGGALGWCDPVEGLAFGYVMNRMDWRVRSPRCLALCKALYDSPRLGPPLRA